MGIQQEHGSMLALFSDRQLLQGEKERCGELKK